jgi:hypothetical protein
MDSNDIYQYAKTRFDNARNQQILREKYQAKLKFAYNGGMWEAGPTLINTLTCMAGTESLVIEDLYNNPVKINAQELLQLAKSHWQEQMNGWLTEYEENSKER